MAAIGGVILASALFGIILCAVCAKNKRSQSQPDPIFEMYATKWGSEAYFDNKANNPTPEQTV